MKIEMPTKTGRKALEYGDAKSSSVERSRKFCIVFAVSTSDESKSMAG